MVRQEEGGRVERGGDRPGAIVLLLALLTPMVRELGQQPIQYVELILGWSAPHLRDEFDRVRSVQREVRCAFVADRTDRTKVIGAIITAHRFVDDVTQVEPGLPAIVIRMWFSSRCAAHLAGEAIAVQYKGARLLGNAPLESRLGLAREQNVLTRLQVAPVVVRLNVEAFLVAQFTNAATELVGAS